MNTEAILLENNSLTSRINSYLENGYKFIKNNHHEWKLINNANLEVVDHVLRVRIQDGSIKNYKDDLLDLCKCQNPDGGWGNYRDDDESKVRSSALSTQMLVRGNRILKDKFISDTITKSLQFIMDKQQDNGCWYDPTWHHYDATSVSVGTLLFATKETEWSKEIYKTTLDKGISYIKSQRDEDSLWYFKKSGSPVTITAHLLPKCVTYEGATKLDFQAVRKLIDLQHIEGHWDNSNTDHTCDAIRAIMLVAGKADNEELYKEVYNSTIKALHWLCNVSENIGGGLGDFPGKKAHVEATCDGIDAVLKFQQFINNPKYMINFWS